MVVLSHCRINGMPPSCWGCRRRNKAVFDTEVIQAAGRGQHVVWNAAELSGAPLVIGLVRYIEINGVVRSTNQAETGVSL